METWRDPNGSGSRPQNSGGVEWIFALTAFPIQKENFPLAINIHLPTAAAVINVSVFEGHVIILLTREWNSTLFSSNGQNWRRSLLCSKIL
jgi:hypothetical protein